MVFEGIIADVIRRKTFPGRITVENGIIQQIEEIDQPVDAPYILPGLIDAHIHIESSMLVPSEFARIAVKHGTTAVVSDPHEIANVLGMDGIRFMIDNGKKVPFRFYFGAPSCVPATPLETSGAVIGSRDVEEMMSWDEIAYLAEMMNYPGVLNADPEVMCKLGAARKAGKPIDGHAPGMSSEAIRTYAQAGISTDHECANTEEALAKIEAGMHILIREGSAARNFDDLIGLLATHPERIMFCSDDKHPDDLVEGHINKLVVRALGLGYDFFDVLRACTLNPVRHYNLQSGLLQQGDAADFILVNDLGSFEVLSTYIGGEQVFDGERSLIGQVSFERPNRFAARRISLSDIQVQTEGNCMKVIDVTDGQLLTGTFLTQPRVEDGLVASDPENDVLKIVALNRYVPAKPAVGFVRGFQLKNGAIASTVAHDSHNIIAVGSHDEFIIELINNIITYKGGLGVISYNQNKLLPLPIAGIISELNVYEVAAEYGSLNRLAREAGTKLAAPFMTLSFMSLLVIPELKIGDRGLFDGRKFDYTSLFDCIV